MKLLDTVMCDLCWTNFKEAPRIPLGKCLICEDCFTKISKALKQNNILARFFYLTAHKELQIIEKKFTYKLGVFLGLIDSIDYAFDKAGYKKLYAIQTLYTDGHCEYENFEGIK